MQPVLQLTHDPDCDDDRNYMTLISNLSDGKSKQMPYRDISRIHRCYRPCVDKVRVDHDHTDDCAQENISSEYSCRRYCDQDRQEGKCCVCKQVKDPIPVASCKCRHCLTKCLYQSHHKTRCYDCRKDRYKNISQCLDHPLEYRLFRCRCCLHFFFGRCGHSADLEEFIVYLIYCAGSDDELKLSVVTENTFHTIDVLKFLHIDLAVVYRYQTQSRCTMCRTYKIGSAANGIKDFFCTLCIIHCHFLSLFPLFLLCALV